MGQGGVYLYLSGKRGRGTYTAWAPSCSCLDLNQVSSALQPDTFHYTLSCKGTITQVSTQMPIHIVLSAMMSVFRYIWWDTDRRDLQQICQIINTRRYYIQRQTVKKRKKKSLITHRNMGKRLREITVCRMMKSKWQTGVGMVCVGIWKQRGIRRGVTSGKVQNLYDNKM